MMLLGRTGDCWMWLKKSGVEDMDAVAPPSLSIGESNLARKEDKGAAGDKWRVMDDSTPAIIEIRSVLDGNLYLRPRERILSCSTEAGIEQNPGPRMSKQTTLETSLDRDKEIKDLINALTKRLDNWGERLESRLSAIDDRVENINQRLQQLEESSAVTKAALSQNSKKIKDLEDQLEYLDAKSRERNLIFYGIEQDINEDCRERIRRVIVENMRTTEKINITRCHRVSRKPGAPILVEVPEQNERTTLFKAAFNLRGTKISLSKDYSMKMREQRRVLNVKRRELVEKDKTTESICLLFAYLPPNALQEQNLTNLLRHIDYHMSEGNEVLIAGDINIRIGNAGGFHNPLKLNSPLNKYRKSKDLISSKLSEKLISFTDSNSITIANGRTKGDTHGSFTFISERGSSVLDYFMYTHGLTQIISDMWIEELSYSDHLPIVLQINTGYEAIKSSYKNEILTRKFIWTKENVEMLKHNLSDIEVGNETDINTETANFTKQIYTAMESANIIKFAKRRHQLSKPWYDKDCYIMKKTTKVSLQRCRNSNNIHDRQKYIEARREYFKLLQRKRDEFNKDKNERIKNAKDPKSFWNAIASFRKKPIIQGEIDIKEWFLFYKNLLNKENKEATFTVNQMIGWKDPDLDAEITLEEIHDVVKKLANGKAVGLDGIPNELLKNLPIPTLNKLKNLFNKIMSTEKYPQLWTNSIVHPIYKSGDKNNPTNYRGIALCSNISKLFTTILRNRLNNWIEKRMIILENQAGFRKNRSCTDHIILLNSLIQLSLRRKRGKLYVFFVDLTKAFDTVPHDLLWQKLHKMGISNKFVMLIKNFYQEAKITIRWKGQYSNNVKINSGVLQGESLSPLLFILYMADLIELYNNSALTGFHLPDFGVLHLLMYADDIAIIGESKINLQIKINLLKSYLDKNKLVLNENKSKIIVFRNGGRPARHENWYWGDTPLTVASNITYLGYPFTSTINSAYIPSGIVTCSNLHPIPLTSPDTAITSIAICLEQSIIVVHSAYWHGLRAADDFIPLLEDTIRRASLPVILGMDTNAHSPTWGIGARLDFRGANLEEFASFNDLHFLGPPVDSTWSNGPLSSSIDVTLASSSLAIHVTRGLSDEMAFTDHIPIWTTFLDMVNNETKSSWVESSCKEQTFKSFINSSLHQASSPEDIDRVVLLLTSILQSACDSSMGRRSNTTRPSKPWWTPELSRIRRPHPQRNTISAHSYGPEFKPWEVLRAIHRCGKRKAPGPNGLGSKCLDLGGPSLQFLLAELFTKCLRMGHFPRQWKEGRLILLPKPSNSATSQLEKYRPITLLNTMAKVFERCILARLQRLADRHGWFFEDQYKTVLGTVNGRSAEDALASITQLIEERQAHWRKTLVISSDISKAFDTVWRQAIIQNLERLNCSESITCLVKSFLEDRTVSYSAWTATECTSSQLGTPQGSALSPFLWNIVARTIFTLPSIIDSRLIAYADDFTLMTQVRSRLPVSATNTFLERLTSWCTINGLNINPIKTQACLFQWRNVHPNSETGLRVLGQPLNIKKTVTILGVEFYQTRGFVAHLRKITRRCRSIIPRLTHTIQESSTEALRAFRNFKGIRRGKGPMSCYSLRRMIKIFEKTGSLEAKPRSGRPSTRKSVAVTVSQNVEAIETLSTYGEVSARQVSRQTGISYGTVWRALRIFLKKYPYKIQRFHELKVGDFEKRQEFAAWVFRQIDIDENWLSNVLWTDEAHFSLNGEVNTQNSRIWATENPRIFTEMPLHQPRVTVWCGFTSSFIIGPFFFEEINGRTFKTVSVTGERYVQLLREKVIPILQDRQALSEITFMQDGGPPHISRGAKQLLKDTFGEDRVISRHFIHQWPSRSPDLTPCDFWLWGSYQAFFPPTRCLYFQTQSRVLIIPNCMLQLPLKRLRFNQISPFASNNKKPRNDIATERLSRQDSEMELNQDPIGVKSDGPTETMERRQEARENEGAGERQEVIGRETTAPLADAVNQLSTLLTRAKISDGAESAISPFDGTYSATQFFQTFDRKMEDASMGEQEKLLRLPNYLVRQPLELFRKLRLADRSYFQVRQILLDLYPESSEASFAKYFAMKLTGQANLETYYREKTAMGLQLGLPQEVILETLTEGLPFNDQRLVRVVPPENLGEWFRLVQRIHGPSVPATRSREDQPPTMSGPYHSTPRRPGAWNAPLPPSNCKFCGARHWHSECRRRPVPKQPAPIPQQP
ncbi:hypothetical protein LAZ67_5003376, partial [Cordylochernes scorpioides]